MAERRTNMRFEWDDRKNTQNIRKHGLDFALAHQVFQRPVLRIMDDRQEYDEDRWIGIGMLDGIRVVVVVFTESLDDDTIRIISMRKALPHERKRYTKTFSNELSSF